MKSIRYFVVFLAILFKAQSAQDLRKLIRKANENGEYANQLVTTAKQGFMTTKKPVFLAFEGTGYLFKAKWAGNVISKLGYFRNGKNLIESAVAKDPASIEIRLIRYLAQTESPKILGYHDDIEQDKKFILRHYMETKDEDLISYINKNLKN